MNRKRSHDDLDDADECLPISKRINSLHLEGKAQGICQRQGPDFNNQPLFHHEDARHMNLEAAKVSFHGQRLPAHSEPNVATGSHMRMPISQFHHPQNFHGSVSPSITTNSTNMNSVHSNHEIFPCHNCSRIEHHGIPNPFYPAQVPFLNESMQISQNCGVNLACVNCSSAMTNFSHIHHADLSISNEHDLQELPSGPYEPELGVKENPHYYNTNKLLYEAHLSRLQRIVPDYQLHS